MSRAVETTKPAHTPERIAPVRRVQLTRSAKPPSTAPRPDLAKRQLQLILDALRPQIQAGMCVVGLEPSCVSVFRTELVDMFPNDADARRLSTQTYLLSEFLTEKAPNFAVPALHATAIVHGHCHQKSVLRFGDEEALLKKLGVDYTVLDSGCCGMAGAFGFEKGEHYTVSIACGERVLLPKVREAALDTLIVSNGFSCREQIAQTTDRQAMHIAQVVKMALDRRPSGPRPELAYMPDIGRAPKARGARA